MLTLNTAIKVTEMAYEFEMNNNKKTHLIPLLTKTDSKFRWAALETWNDLY